MDILNQTCCSTKSKQYISCAILLIGLIFYCAFQYSYEFMPSAIIMLLTILCWIVFNLYYDSFNNITFSKIIFFSGLILSISIFFFYGVEEIAYPKGAILFHSIGIAISLLTLMLSVLPLLFLRHQHLDADSSNHQYVEMQDTPTEPTTISQTDGIDDWEIASEDDLESGNFEVAA